MNSLPYSEWMPRRGNGRSLRIPRSAAKTCSWLLFRIALVSVHPVTTSVTSRVQAYSPPATLPSLVTRSTATNPGLVRSHSAAVWTGTCLRRSMPGRGCWCSQGSSFVRTSWSNRSQVAGLMRRRRSRTAGARSSCPRVSRKGMMRCRNGTRRLPQSLSDRCQNSVSAERISPLYTDARGRWTGPLPCATFALRVLRAY